MVPLTPELNKKYIAKIYGVIEEIAKEMGNTETAPINPVGVYVIITYADDNLTTSCFGQVGSRDLIFALQCESERNFARRSKGEIPIAT